MTLARKEPKTWVCPRAKCGHKNLATRSRKCQGCGELSRPKKRERKHKAVLREILYPEWEKISYEIHGHFTELGACGVCGKQPTEGRPRHDRDHDHRVIGRVRGLACPGDNGCNILMLPWITAATARGIADAKWEANEPDAQRWENVARYLDRVEAYYRERDQ